MEACHQKNLFIEVFLVLMRIWTYKIEIRIWYQVSIYGLKYTQIRIGVPPDQDLKLPLEFNIKLDIVPAHLKTLRIENYYTIQLLSNKKNITK